MSRKYKIRNQDKLHFVTFSVVYWLDVFTRDEFRKVLLDSLEHCQKNKGLAIYAWIIMTNHAHFIMRAEGGNRLEGIIRDLKSFTSRSIRILLENEQSTFESRREWLLWMMKRAGMKCSQNRDFQFWQQHNQPIELSTNEMVDQRVEYIHQNPVRQGFVEFPEMWKHSSAVDYLTERKGLLDISFVDA